MKIKCNVCKKNKKTIQTIKILIQKGNKEGGYKICAGCLESLKRTIDEALIDLYKKAKEK